MSANVITVADEAYDAENLGGDVWIVHWFKKDGTTVEAEIIVANASAAYVVQLAIKRGSWD
jgi:hypothetical protein